MGGNKFGLGQWMVALSWWPVVLGRWPVVLGQWMVVLGRWPEAFSYPGWYGLAAPSGSSGSQSRTSCSTWLSNVSQRSA
jgi:hypothetical protein